MAQKLGILFATLVGLATLFTPASAEAHNRPLYAGFGGGPYLMLNCDGCRVHGRVQGEFGIHFSRNDRGFFLAFEGVNTFGDDFFTIFGGVRLGGDIEIYGRHDYGIMLRPSGLFGFGWHDSYWGSDWAVFVLQPAFDFRFVFAHRVLALWVRPVAFDFMFFVNRRNEDFGVGYQFLVGLDFQFR